jgi:hypothetical protein
MPKLKVQIKSKIEMTKKTFDIQSFVIYLIFEL